MTVRFRIILSLLICLIVTQPAFGLVMTGKVYDRKTQQPLAGVNIINLNTQLIFQTDSSGLFTITVQPNQVIKFRKMGYQLAQVRITSSSLPYYSIGLKKGAYIIPDVTIKGNNFRSDSIENQEMYAWAINHYTLEGLDLIQHPFDALSKRNRQIWAFQKRFKYFEEQKFIDYVFNERLIHKITGLKSNSLKVYRKKYRPTYTQIQSWSTYEFYEYIKYTGQAFSQGKNPY